MAPPDDLPSPRETSLAYGTTCVASLVWIACVIPGAVLADATLSSDLATPMARGPFLLLPALLLLVTGPIAVLLAGNADGMRSLLAAGDAFVTLFAAGILLHDRQGDTARLVAALALVVLLVVATRDAIRPAKAGPAPRDDAPRLGASGAGGVGRTGGGNLRLALAMTALLMPASLLTAHAGERASYLAPFAYVAISALGSRLAHTLVGLRLTAALLLFGVSVHQVVAIRYATEDGVPVATGWTAAGLSALALAGFVALLTSVWAVVLVARLRRSAPAEVAS